MRIIVRIRTGDNSKICVNPLPVRVFDESNNLIKLYLGGGERSMIDVTIERGNYEVVINRDDYD